MTLCQHRGHLHPRIPAECGTLNPTGSTSPVIFCYHPFLSVLCLLPCSQAIISVLPLFLSSTCGYRFNSAVGCTPATLSQSQQFFKALPGLTSGNSLPDTSLPGGTPFLSLSSRGRSFAGSSPPLRAGNRWRCQDWHSWLFNLVLERDAPFKAQVNQACNFLQYLPHFLQQLESRTASPSAQDNLIPHP